MADSKQGAGDETDDEQASDNEVLVLTFPVPREVESEPPDDDPDDIPTIIPEESLAPPATTARNDDAPTLPPEESPTEPPPARVDQSPEDTPTEPPEEPSTLIPPTLARKRASRPPS